MLTNISIEHFLNTTTRDFFHSMRWSPRLNLNNPKWKMISRGKSYRIILYACCMPCNICHIFVFSPEYTWSSKVKHCVWVHLVKGIDGQCLCSSLSVVSDYAITGSTPHCICKADELNHFAWCRIYALVNWIRGTGSALFQVMAGCLFGTRPFPKVILAYCQLYMWE